MHRHSRTFRTLVPSLAVVALVLAGAGCSSDKESSSSTTTTTSAASATTAPTGGPNDGATGNEGAEEESSATVDCTRTQNALNKVIAISSTAGSGQPVTRAQFTQDLAEARKQVSVVQGQAANAGAPAPAIQLWTQYVNDTIAVLEQAAEGGNVAAAGQQLAALTTPQVTQAKTQVGDALQAACPGLTGWTD